MTGITNGRCDTYQVPGFPNANSCKRLWVTNRTMVSAEKYFQRSTNLCMMLSKESRYEQSSKQGFVYNRVGMLSHGDISVYLSAYLLLCKKLGKLKLRNVTM